MIAARAGHLDIVEFLVTHGADKNVKSGYWGKFLILYFIGRNYLFLTFKKKILSI